MNDLKKGDIPIIKKAELIKNDHYQKDIEKLVEKYQWELEKTPSLFALNSILVKMLERPAGDNRPLPEIQKFKKELECIFKNMI